MTSTVRNQNINVDAAQPVKSNVIGFTYLDEEDQDSVTVERKIFVRDGILV